MNDNLFNLTDVSNWQCTVRHLAPGHGSLDIEIYDYRIETRMKLSFHLVSYFGGWTEWQGANFRLSTDEEYLKLARTDLTFSDARVEELSYRGILGISKLFICDSEDRGKIYVMAGGGTLFDKDGNELVSRSVPKI